MKCAIAIFVFLVCLAQNSFAGDSKLFSTDHAAHFGISFMATELGYAFGKKLGASRTEAWFLSALSVNIAGAVKELALDKHPEKLDLLSNAAGSASAGLFVWSFDF